MIKFCEIFFDSFTMDSTIWLFMWIIFISLIIQIFLIFKNRKGIAEYFLKFSLLVSIFGTLYGFSITGNEVAMQKIPEDRILRYYFRELPFILMPLVFFYII
jgi:hypothetical protein